MKKLLTSLFFVSLFGSIQAQVVPSDCTTPQLLATEYKRDVVNIALERLFQFKSPDTIFVKVPQNWTDTISEGLAAIFNATSLPERDSIFNLYCVHNINGWPFSYGGFLVKVDTTYSWTHAWQNMSTNTGNSFMDEITTRYGLQIANFYNWSSGNYAELSTGSSWNIFALEDSINMIAGVISTELNSVFGEAGKITYSKIGVNRYYNFYFEFNDCYDGCDNYRVWRYKVNSDCSVEYLGFADWGYFATSNLPTPINCNTFSPVTVENTKQEANCQIFPNPANDFFTIKTLNHLDRSNYIITDITGRKIITGKLNPDKNASVNISQLNKGIYFLQVGEENKMTFKVMI